MNVCIYHRLPIVIRRQNCLPKRAQTSIYITQRVHGKRKMKRVCRSFVHSRIDGLALCATKGQERTHPRSVHWVPTLWTDDPLFPLFSHYFSLREAGGVWARARWYVWYFRLARRLRQNSCPFPVSATERGICDLLDRKLLASRRPTILFDENQNSVRSILAAWEIAPIVRSRLARASENGQYFADSVHATVEIPIYAW